MDQHIQYQAHVEPILPPQPRMDSWFRLLSEPTRFKPNRNVLYQNQFQSILRPITPDIYWYRGFEERPRRKIDPHASRSPLASLDPYPIPNQETPTGWFNLTTDPVRKRNWLWSALQEPYTGPISPPAPIGTYWFQLLSEPVRNKRGLRADLQDVTEREIPPFPPTMAAWFEPLSEPIRLNLLRGLKAWLQQFEARYPDVIPLTAVTVVISATETNSDVFACAILVQDTPPPPITVDPYALVSVQEIMNPYWNSPISIVEH